MDNCLADNSAEQIYEASQDMADGKTRRPRESLQPVLTAARQLELSLASPSQLSRLMEKTLRSLLMTSFPARRIVRSVSTSSQMTLRSLSASESCRRVEGGGNGESGLGEEDTHSAHSVSVKVWPTPAALEMSLDKPPDRGESKGAGGKEGRSLLLKVVLERDWLDEPHRSSTNQYYNGALTFLHSNSLKISESSSRLSPELSSNSPTPSSRISSATT
ncbi:hypothetical protein FQN60_004839 [Etheostoma spectabile]|uniref:Uncharacterized protein n=1 Tax=Etheostoma spectabile TaxID=54343 RepID=A0A5J5DKS1_9PERO|nr:hypothetical protein FQN60_004839 [Etheostoma spectabile]